MRGGGERWYLNVGDLADWHQCNYNEVLVWSVCLNLCHNIHNLFQLFFASPKGGRRATPPIYRLKGAQSRLNGLKSLAYIF